MNNPVCGKNTSSRPSADTWKFWIGSICFSSFWSISQDRFLLTDTECMPSILFWATKEVRSRLWYADEIDPVEAYSN